jgi:hypothetical protein
MLRLTRKQIDEQDQEMLARQARFRVAADVVTDAFARFPEVEALALIGSVARPLRKELPRFSEFRKERVEVWHECKDVDLAVWITRLDRLRELNRARNFAAQGIHPKFGFGVANHEIDIFLLEPGSDRYLGRLCQFAQCPKGKRECEVIGCGQEPFLRQHEDFVFWSSALDEDRIVRLYCRDEGVIRRAAEIPATGERGGSATSSRSRASGASSRRRRTSR